MYTDFPTPEQWQSFTSFLGRFWAALPWIIGGAVLCVVAVFALRGLLQVTLSLLDMRRLMKREAVFLELTPAAFQDRTPRANEELYKVLSGLADIRSWQDKLLRRRAVFSLAIVGTRESGIKYVVQVDKRFSGSFKKDVTALHRDIRISEVNDYLAVPSPGKDVRILEFRQTQHYSQPLKYDGSTADLDPMAYVAGALANLQSGEQIVLQVTLASADAHAVRELNRRAVQNVYALDRMGKRGQHTGSGVLANIAGGLALGLVDLAGDIFHGPSRSAKHDKRGYERQERPRQVSFTHTASEHEFVKTMQNNKIGQELYEANIRALIIMNNKQRGKEYSRDIRKALGVYNIPGYQSLVVRTNFPYSIKGQYRQFMFSNRLLAVTSRGRCKLSTSEIAAIFHFPHSVSAPNADVVSALSRRLPVPPEIRRRADSREFDVVLGESEFQGVRTDIGLTAQEREKHMYVIGATGSGKTTMLEYAIAQDIRSGKGVAVIDPHGDLAKKLLQFIPEERMNDVIYFDPSDFDHPIGLNLLELPQGLEGSALAHEKDRVTEAIISVMRKVFEDGMEGSAHRIDRIMRKGIHTAMTVENATLFTVLDLMSSAEYRKKIAKNLQDPMLRRFWKEELDPAGEMQRVKITSGPISRIDRFNQSEAVKRVIGQPKSTIDFDDIMNTGKILICRFAKGRIGEDTSTLFGTTVLAKLQLASWRREELNPQDRKPFYLYVDEFQNFAGDSFEQILSEARKYKLFLTMAEQSTAQQQSQMVEVVLNNVGTVVCFRTGGIQDEKLMLHQFKPFVQEDEIKNLSAYNFYMKISAQDVFPTFSGITKVLEGGSEATAARAIETSRTLYAGEYADPESNPSQQSQERGKKSGAPSSTVSGDDNEQQLADDLEATA